ncbi:ABC transporter ATP-binding protein [Pleomorphomonas diazotrophica]|uniref:ABC transporter ATP-binding protein n=1 Tax=Pleomorphomonas diazotrophica TaxID=1166257 RepID=A0A1I4QU46_9HYPH|nr:ATP-binding cassette domain-containing protein [Pleomorphomonas diazotrophica]PKR90423.1 ABC transporter ATP-binding protein [Pleomorphomonas diazotrophica]SFM43602.1 tungstate transport system ATP-binding protein [Pleomorphomonas diazotrophica]
MRDTTSLLPLIVRDLRLERDGRVLLDVPIARIQNRQRNVILGPNGAGKSLFLKTCHGLVPPTSGSIEFTRPASAADNRRKQAMVFQKPVMLRRSVRANFMHALAMAGVGWRERRRIATETMAQFGLSSLADMPARVLSGGEQQRLAIARAASLWPDLLFLDEPTSSLDPTASRQIEDMLEILHERGVTLVLTTHDLGLARRFADVILFFHNGRLVEESNAERFFTAPQTPEAKAFLEHRLFW